MRCARSDLSVGDMCETQDRKFFPQSLSTRCIRTIQHNHQSHRLPIGPRTWSKTSGAGPSRIESPPPSPQNPRFHCSRGVCMNSVHSQAHTTLADKCFLVSTFTPVHAVGDRHIIINARVMLGKALVFRRAEHLGCRSMTRCTLVLR